MSEQHYDCPCMEKCPLHHAMQLIGGKWKVQILCAVCNAGAIRYNALRGKLDGVSNTVLSSALRELERDGLLTRKEYLEVPVRVEYSPTDSCRELLPILEQLSDWAEKQTVSRVRTASRLPLPARLWRCSAWPPIWRT